MKTLRTGLLVAAATVALAGTAALGGTAAPASASGDVTLDPSSTIPGGVVTVTVNCDSPPEDGWIDAPESFGQKYLNGKSSIDVKIPKGTPPGKQRINAYCTDSTEPSGWAFLTVEGDVPDTGPRTGDGATAMTGGPMKTVGGGLLAAGAVAGTIALIRSRRRVHVE